MKNKILSVLTIAGLALLALGTGCMTFSKTTINTPAVYQVATNATGVVATNLVSPAKSIITKERTWLPDNYALLMEEDVYGGKFTFASPSSPYPDAQFGISHSSARWVPTSTNRLYAARMAATGSINNKAVPFWMAADGSFQAGDLYVTQGTDTNGQPYMTVTAILPGTPTNQVPGTNTAK